MGTRSSPGRQQAEWRAHAQPAALTLHMRWQRRRASGATVGESTLTDTVSYDRSLNEEVAARGQSREGDPCRRMLLGHAGSDPQTTGCSVDEGGIYRRRRRERDVP